MSVRKITVSPITRGSGQLTIQVAVKQGRVVDARVIGGVYRGYEAMMVGRDPRDAAYFMEKICGICSTAHANAASLMLDEIYDVEVPKNGRLMRNLMLGADLLQNYLRHFYFFEVPDFVRAPEEFPLFQQQGRDYRLSRVDTERLLAHYQEAVTASRLCHEMGAVMGGKMPHPHGLVSGGATVAPLADILNQLAALLARVRNFIDNRLTPDTQLLAETYSDYYQIGRGPGNFLSFGGFPDGDIDGRYYIPAGVVIKGRRQKMDLSLISESVVHTWLKGDTDENPGDLMERPELPDPYKRGAYTWVEAPRYAGEVMEVGPLARAVVRGDASASSTMDRITARSGEAAMIGRWMSGWLEQLEIGKPVYQPPGPPVRKKAFGLVEAVRGSLLHGVELEEGKVARYKVITPSEWNFSPRDGRGQRGPVEQSLIGVPVEDADSPVEVGRVARSFDPCLYCATHVIKV